MLYSFFSKKALLCYFLIACIVLIFVFADEILGFMNNIGWISSFLLVFLAIGAVAGLAAEVGFIE